MVNFYHRLLYILVFPTVVLAQITDQGTGGTMVIELNDINSSVDRFQSDKHSSVDSSEMNPITGNITSIFHEEIDSVWIIYKIEKENIDSVLSTAGNFIIPQISLKKTRLVELTFKHPEYHIFDTSFVRNSTEAAELNIQLTPKYKISLRGRVFAGNLPIQGVKVQIKVKDKIFLLETKGCYYDSENYWNCLYDGMFKQDLIMDSSNDSINLTFEKDGMKPLTLGMILADYSGDILNVKMRYASKLSEQSMNSVSLKLSFPLLSLENNWFVSLSYYRMLKGNFLNRFSAGLEANLLLSPISKSYPTFQDNSASFDTSYISGYIGPSVLFWIRKPDNRYFSTYAGITAGLGIDDGDFYIQPFIGSRVFIDFNKAISFEIRHISYDLETVNYTFNPYGNAYRTLKEEDFNDFLIDIGIHIVF